MKKSDTGRTGAKKSELGRFSLQCERSQGVCERVTESKRMTVCVCVCVCERERVIDISVCGSK